MTAPRPATAKELAHALTAVHAYSGDPWTEADLEVFAYGDVLAVRVGGDRGFEAIVRPEDTDDLEEVTFTAWPPTVRFDARGVFGDLL